MALFSPGGNAPLLRAEFGPANLRLLDDAALVNHFKAIKKFCGNGAARLGGIAIGMAGARTEADCKRIRDAAAKVWRGTNCYATNDLETALAAGASGDNNNFAARILILSGTGSCCYGRRVDGEVIRLGGWGHILGDRGSGYEIGLRGLRTAIEFLDREGRWSLLGRTILGALLLDEADDLIDWANKAGKSEIAALAEQVFAAAAKGDKAAVAILSDAAESLAKDGVHCARRLVAKGARVEFIFAGSVLLKQPAFARRVRTRLLTLWPKAKVARLEQEGAFGALELARAHFGGGKHHDKITRSKPTEPLPVSALLSPTEQRNPRSRKWDSIPLSKAVALMLDEEAKVTSGLRKVRAEIERVIEMVVAALKKEGRLFYVGAGTSGRLGVLDASECPPTFRTPPELVQGIIAGGPSALWKSVEGAEDNAAAGAAAIEYRGVTRRDVVIGIAASGRTPFVWGALGAARKLGAKTALICFNPHLEIPAAIRPQVVIAADVGPEVLTGSTRLKAGTATKIILNAVTTLTMVRLGKVMSNLMIDVNASNEKLRQRAVRIVQAVTGAEASRAEAALREANWVVKAACQKLKTTAHKA